MTLDLKAVLANLDGDKALFIELAGLFCAESPKALSALRAAVAQKDAKAIRAAAHSLKGSVGTFHAQGAIGAATWLEAIAEAGELSNAVKAGAALEAEVVELVLALQNLCAAGQIADPADLPAEVHRPGR
jgi:two-component system, sensor histidine kinase and response regulator